MAATVWDEATKDRLLFALRAESTPVERVEALSEIGFKTSQVADAIGVTPEAIRQWRAGGRPRPATAEMLDDLRFTTLTLLVGGVAVESVLAWFTARRAAGVPRPLEVFAEHPETVMAAAEARVNGLGHTERVLLTEAVAQPPAEPAAVAALDSARKAIAAAGRSAPAQARRRSRS